MKKLLIFDFDGVLEDTFDINFEVARTRYEGLEREDYRTWFDGNIYEHPVVQAAGPENITDFFKDYRQALESAEKVMSEELKEMLFTLRAHYRRAIISSTDDDLLHAYLKKSKVDHLFDEVWGHKRHLSKVEKFNSFLELYKLHPHECWFITDTLGDIKEANRVGIESIGVTWGFQGRDRLEQGKPSKIVDTPKELLGYLLGSG